MIKQVKILAILVMLLPAGVLAQSKYSQVDVMDRMTINYPDKKVVAYVRPVKGYILTDPEKTYFWYSSNQVRSTQGGYSGKVLNGPYSEYYLNRNLKEQGTFTRGLKSGIWTSWTDAGMIKERVTWNEGQKTGRYTRYDSKGKPAESGRMHNGQLKGTVKTYHAADSVSTSYYKNGQKTDKKPIVPGFIRNLFKKKEQPAQQR